ncbi:tetrahydromethanopterin S-methyltransferase subunit A [Tepidibacter aestuarii]|nr:tetrahydromethanopterin S-methyltransferase subunit A [Tepidibacter aestuarii]
MLAVPSIKYLIVCGKDSEGHYSGNTLVSLFNNGIDNNMRVIASKGKKPILSNTTKEEVNAFRNQIEIIDMIECEDLNKILEKIQQLCEQARSSYSCEGKCSLYNKKLKTSSIEIIKVEEKDPNKVKLDKAGYFVIVPKENNNTILVEHYSYNNKLLRIIKGEDARNIYWSIIENGWITELSHAAYLGKELTRAEMSIKLGFKYVQDKA